MDSCTDSWIMDCNQNMDCGTDSRIFAHIHGIMNQNTVECTKIHRVANPSLCTYHDVEINKIEHMEE